MFTKLPPNLSVPIFYVFATAAFLYRFLFGNIYGIFVTSLVLYKYSQSLFGITPLGFGGLINWVVIQSESTKAALLGAIITIVGFLIAYATATANWKSQLLANLKVQAAGELEVFFAECYSNRRQKAGISKQQAGSKWRSKENNKQNTISGGQCLGEFLKWKGRPNIKVMIWNKVFRNCQRSYKFWRFPFRTDLLI
jgi:type IV secretory pathway TraG/TraD family ATPase VirD4